MHPRNKYSRFAPVFREHVRRRCAISDGRFQGGDKGGVSKKGFVSKDTSDDDMTITESRRKTVVKVEPTSSSQGKKSKDGVLTRSAHQ